MTAIGVAGLAFILYLMLFKPTLGLTPEQEAGPRPGAQVVRIEADELTFTAGRLVAPASRPFSLAFDNRAGVPHNVAIYEPAGRVAFTGEIFSGPKAVTYAVPALPAGTYAFRCDVHPGQMKGTLVAG